jgi:hypothetical protein
MWPLSLLAPARFARARDVIVGRLPSRSPPGLAVMALVAAFGGCNHPGSSSGPGAGGSRAERSRALFVEVSHVLSHPRCLNCHPADGGGPTLGDRGYLHDPPIARGLDGTGVPGLECRSCHQDTNLELARVPGAPGWRVAPPSMAWQGRSAAEICAQLKDPARNGGRTLAQIIDHAAHDSLVAWGWAPGEGRTPVPGTQDAFSKLLAAWVDSGAECPREHATAARQEVSR